MEGMPCARRWARLLHTGPPQTPPRGGQEGSSVPRGVTSRHGAAQPATPARRSPGGLVELVLCLCLFLPLKIFFFFFLSI